MTDQAIKDAQNAYKRAWNARNPEKNKEYQRRYWTKKAKEIELERAKTESLGRQTVEHGIESEAD